MAAGEESVEGGQSLRRKVCVGLCGCVCCIGQQHWIVVLDTSSVASGHIYETG